MAEVKNNSLFEINGKIGDFVVRKVNGKTFISYRPGKYKISQTKRAKDSRNNFGAAAKFSSVVNKDKLLAKTWQESKYPGNNAYRKILKENLKYVSNSNLTEKNLIVPPGTFCVIKDITFNGKAIQITFAEISFNAAKIKSSPFNINVICYLDAPRESGLPAINFISLSKVITASELDTASSTKINLTGYNEMIISQYKKMLAYSALIIEGKDCLKWSHTFVKSLID